MGYTVEVKTDNVEIALQAALLQLNISVMADAQNEQQFEQAKNNILSNDLVEEDSDLKQQIVDWMY